MSSAIVTGVSAMRDCETSMNADARLDALSRALDGDLLLQVAVIRKTRVTWWHWLNRSCHARVVVHFQEAFERDRSVAASPEAIAKAFQAATLIRYGVAVDHRHFRQLRGLVVDGIFDDRRLAALLSYPTIWWGTNVRPSADDGFALARTKRLWAMGRPASGELTVARFHLLTSVLLTVLSVASIGGAAYLVYATTATVLRHGPVPEAAVFAMAASQLALLSSGLLWLGPYADRAATVLSKAMREQPRIPLPE